MEIILLVSFYMRAGKIHFLGEFSFNDILLLYRRGRDKVIHDKCLLYDQLLINLTGSITYQDGIRYYTKLASEISPAELTAMKNDNSYKSNQLQAFIYERTETGRVASQTVQDNPNEQTAY